MSKIEGAIQKLFVEIISFQVKADESGFLENLTDLINRYLQVDLIGLFLFSQDSKSATIQAGSGKVGKLMVAKKHTITLRKSPELFMPALNGEIRIVDGWSGKMYGCTLPADPIQKIALQLHKIQQEPIVNAQNVATYQSAQLPEPRWEIILPLQKNKHVVGALYLQVMEFDRFVLADCQHLKYLADKIGDIINTFAKGRVKK